MKTLILETSSETGCIILAEKDHLIETLLLPGGPELSQTLAQKVRALTSNHPKIDLIAIGEGPGSYTGIRVAAALAQALSYGWNIPLTGFCSLKAFGEPPILVDARGPGFYALLDGVPLLLSPEDPRLKDLPEIGSPHPEKIAKRLPIPTKINLFPLNPILLAKCVWNQFLEEGARPIQLNYLSHP